MARIILINRYFHPDESATAQLLTDLALELAQKHEVIALCSRQLLDQPGARLPAEGRLSGMRIHRLWSTSWGRGHLVGRALDYLSFLANVGAWLMLRLRRGDVVLAKTDPPLLGVVAVLASFGRGAAVVHWLQDLYPETAWRLGVSDETSTLGRILAALRNWSLRRGRLTVVVSAGMGAYLQDKAGIAPLCCIPNWADDLRRHRHASATSYRTELGLGNKLVIGYSGNLGRAHPIGTLQLLAQRRRDDSACHFFITGGGVHFDALRASIERDGIRNWSFLPYQPRERLPDLIATADLCLVLLDPRVERFVFPSKVYGILSAGRPVLHLGDPDGELANLLRELGCGWSLSSAQSPNGVDAVQGLLAHLRHNRQELVQKGLQARQAYDSQFSKHLALGRWTSALAPLLR